MRKSRFEVVIEQPPPKPKPPEDQPKPPPQPDLEKPAYDAPAPPTQEKVNRQSPDKTTEAKAAARGPSPARSGRFAESGHAGAGAPPGRPEERRDGAARTRSREPEGELPADRNPKSEDNPAQAAAPATPPAPKKAPVRTPIPPTIEDLPQYKFARSVEDSPVAGGAETRYLTIVCRKIKAHLHETADLHLDLANRHGMVDFYVDEGGNLVGRRLISTSGSPDLDIAVMTAIAETALRAPRGGAPSR